MTLRTIKVDKGVKDIARSVQFRERDSKPNIIRNFSLPRKQNKKLSQKNAKII